MSVVRKGRVTQIAIDPSYLVPWVLAEGNKVLIVGQNNWTGQVGKLVKLDQECCAVELGSGEVAYLIDKYVVNILEK